MCLRYASYFSLLYVSIIIIHIASLLQMCRCLLQLELWFIPDQGCPSCSAVWWWIIFSKVQVCYSSAVLLLLHRIYLFRQSSLHEVALPRFLVLFSYLGFLFLTLSSWSLKAWWRKTGPLRIGLCKRKMKTASQLYSLTVYFILNFKSGFICLRNVRI